MTILRFLSVCLLLICLPWAGLQAAPGKKQTLATADQPRAEGIELGSVSAVVYDSAAGITLYSKNEHFQVPIASITKLMTAMVVLDAQLPMNEWLMVTREDQDLLRNTFSRVRFGSTLKRKDLLLIALMSSENRAASALGRNYPGGRKAFVQAMNDKAAVLGMKDTRFVDSTGLSEENVSTAEDLVKMVGAALQYDEIREFTTTPNYLAKFRKPRYNLGYVNTNLLVRRGEWEIGLSKTGFINEAGHCLVMQADIAGKPVVMVLLDSFGKRTSVGDAGRVKKWLNTGNSGKLARAARDYARTKAAEVAESGSEG
ncbi:MAG: D-alanyl-D-alanine endopeptidase [Hahellaceae bacterium]|nr:D-alanyl-D-alanine endopeptidase [Hahellaceae bacterium]